MTSVSNGLVAGYSIGRPPRYRIEHVLGSGGFGTAYLATDTQLDRPCVVKHLVIQPAWSVEEQHQVLQSFEREARLLVTLNTPGHPNIPEIYAYLPDERCLVMKYIPGQNLSHLLHHHGGALPYSTALRYVRDVCSALVYMHSRTPEPVLHRDIKPANILLDAEQRVWLIDFGLAKSLVGTSSMVPTEHSQIAGTPGYTPPEQWHGVAEPRSDIYALAVTLHTLLSGQKPALNASDYMDIMQGNKSPVPPLRQLCPDISLALEALIQRSIAFNPSVRPTAQTFLDTLETLLMPTPDILPPPQPARSPDTSRFVGRTAELAFYADQLATTRQTLVVGPAGVGKTTLAAALAQHIQAPRTFWHTFYQNEGIESLIWKLAAFFAWHGQQDLWQTLQYSRQGDGQLPPADTLLDYIIQMLANQETLLCFDNIQEIAQHALFAPFIHRLATLKTSRLIMTTRQVPDFIPTTHVAPLEGLSADDTQRLLQAHGHDLARPLFAQLHAMTEGNAQFLILASDVIRTTTNPERLIDNLTDTDDIEHYLLREVDASLTEDERDVMTGLSVLEGYPETRDAIETVVEQGRLRRTLNDLQHRHLVLVSRPDDDGERRYRQHAMVQAFYYDMMTKRERRDMHCRAADYYEQMDDWLKAAHHALRSDNHQRAAKLATTSVWQVVNQGETDALGLVLDQIECRHLDWVQHVAVLLAHGQVATVQRNSERGRAFYQDALNLLDNQQSTPQTHQFSAQAYRGMGTLLEYENPHEALTWLERGLDHVRQLDSSAEAALMHHRIGSVFLALGNYARAAEELLESMRLLPNDATRSRADVLMNLGVVHCCRGNVDEGKACYQQAHELYQQTFHYWGMLGIRGNLGFEMRLAGDWANAEAEYRTMREMAVQLGSVTHQATAELNLGLVVMNQGNYDAAWKHLATCLELSRDKTLCEFEIASLASLADLHIRLGDTEAAATLLTEVVELAHRFDAQDQLPEIYRLQARVALKQKALDTALELAQRSEHIARQIESVLDQGTALRVIGQVLQARDNHTGAMIAFEQSLEILDQCEPYEAARTRRQWGEALQSRSCVEQSARLLREAQTTFAFLGARADLEELEQWMSETLPANL